MKRRNLLTYSLLFLAGCTATRKKSNPSEILTDPNKKLRFTVTDVKNLEQLQQKYEVFRKTLEETLKQPIEFFPVKNHINAASDLKLDRVDLVLAGPSEYVIIRARTNAVPIVALTRPGYRSVIAVRADSGIKSLAQLKGKTIAVVNLASTASHLGSMELLIEAGLNIKSDLKVVILEDETNGERVLNALIKGEIDACGLVFRKYKEYLKVRGLSQQDFPAIAKGPQLPSDIFVVNSKFSTQSVETMRLQMLANRDKLIASIVATQSKFKGANLVASKDSDYDMIRQVYRSLGQDIEIE
ncbi:MAG: PhnD/SsuA/transferrin family substrate-binding protein [Prochloraceae cyanobacterium]|nr:PhnD/SsuA/transferrin family substrate-binding protein [Prochloraceae cyanobacterium]